MFFNSNGISCFYKSKGEGEVLGSRPIWCVSISSWKKKKKKRNESSSMQLIKAKSETLYYENSFCSESLGTSFYNFFHNCWYGLLWLVDNKSGTGGIPNWKWYCFNYSRPFVLYKNYYSYLFDYKPFANELMISWLLLVCIFAMMCVRVMFRTFRFDKIFWHASWRMD